MAKTGFEPRQSALRTYALDHSTVLYIGFTGQLHSKLIHNHTIVRPYQNYGVTTSGG